MQNKRRFEQYHRYGLLFIAPFFLAFLVFQLYPILYTIYLSFTDLKGWNPAANLVGLDNYFAIFRN
ncbi:sugar ABC transporter permease, partial [Listeria monocytogenes]|nr:sugar ABC transporter permease [Listeria monocytogenes]EAG2874461.1 sugar ABC transporter permease [Listeria monocytogenes]